MKINVRFELFMILGITVFLCFTIPFIINEVHKSNLKHQKIRQEIARCEANGGYYYSNKYATPRTPKCHKYPVKCIEYTYKNVSVVQRLECEKLWEQSDE